MALNSTFSVNASTAVQAHAVAYGAVATFAIQDLTGVKDISWSIVGTSKSTQAAITITPAGTPTGATATATMPSDPGDGLGRAFAVKLTVSNARESSTTYRVFGAANVGGIIPAVAGEELWRSATHGSTDVFNQALAVVGLSLGAGADSGDELQWNGSIYIPKRGWITPSLDLTGTVDATSAINAAFAARNGVCVYIPDSGVRINGEITMSRGSALVGRPNGMHFGHKQYDVAANIGSMINVYGTSTPAITPHEQCTIESLTFYYPSQNTNSAPVSYGYTIDAPLGSGVHGLNILNVTGINPEKFIRCCVNGARIDNIQGAPLRRGIDLGRCADVIRVSNVHFNAGGVFGSGVSGATLIAWVLANGTAFSVDGAEGFDFSACFPAGYLIGLDFSDVDADAQTSYGHWRGGGIEGCKTSVRVAAETGLATLNISDCAFVGGDAAGHIVDFLDSGASTDKPRIFATNWHCWGSSDAIVNFASTSNGRFIHHGGAVFGYTGTAYRTNATANMNVLRLSHVGSQTTSRTNGAGDIHDVGAWPT